jgi:CheY-like chemotaxis protein
VADSPARDVSRPLALIVDDDHVVRALLRHGLEGAGLDVIEACDGTDALQQLVDHLLDLDLLVTDLRMPGVDGITLVKVVRSGGEHELAILVVAATVTADDREALQPLGVDAVVEKSQGSEEVVRRAVALAGAAWERRRAGEDLAPDLAPAAAVPIGAVPLVRRAG